MNFDFQQFLGRKQGYDKESFIEAVMYGDENMLEKMSGSLTDSMIINEYLDIGENHQKMTALYYAVVFGTKDRIVSILANTKEIDVNKGHVSGRTPLVAAVIHNRAYAIKQLCKEKQLDVSHQNWVESEEKQREMFDIKTMYPLVVRLAVEGKAVPDICKPDKQNKDEDTLVHMAVEAEQVDSIKHLRRKGYNFKIQNKDKETPLHVALKSGNTNIVDTILELNDEKIDLNLCDKKGNTALHLALKGNFFEIAERLIVRDKVDPNIANENNETVLHLAVPKKATNIIKRVCEKQSIIYDFTTKNIEGKTAFDMNTAIRGKITEAEYSSILLVGIKTVSRYDEDWDHIDAKHFQIKDELITVIQSNDIPKILEKLLEKKEGVTSTLEYLQETMNKKEEHNSACAALLKFIIKGVEKFANQSRLKYVFYESSNFNVLIKIFVEGYDKDKNSPFLVHLLSILYISLQANISCKCTEIEPVAEEKLAMRTTRQYMTDALKEKLYPESLLEDFKRQIQEIVLNVGKGEKLNKTQLIAHNIDELYFKCIFTNKPIQKVIRIPTNVKIFTNKRKNKPMIVMETTNKQMNKQSSDISDANNNKQTNRQTYDSDENNNKQTDKPMTMIGTPTNKPMILIGTPTNKRTNKPIIVMRKPTNKRRNKPIIVIGTPTNKRTNKPIIVMGTSTNKRTNKPIIVIGTTTNKQTYDSDGNNNKQTNKQTYDSDEKTNKQANKQTYNSDRNTNKQANKQTYNSDGNNNKQTNL
ncbi:hypothetical protein ACHWQZ_G004834 [Mnemiopsis leidyi]